MLTHEKLREQIRDFQQFIVTDLWSLSHVTEDAHDLSSIAQADAAAMDDNHAEEAAEAEEQLENDREDASDL